MQIIHVSHLFKICSVKQILQSLDSNELQFCCFFVFVAVEFFFLAYVRTYAPPLPQVRKRMHLYSPPPPPSPRTAYVLNGWSLSFMILTTFVYILALGGNMR